MMETIAIIGLGEIGSITYWNFRTIIKNNDLPYHLTGYDVNKATKSQFPPMHYSDEFPKADIYIICVWDFKQILSVMREIERVYPKEGDYPKLVSIESTIDPSRLNDLFCIDFMTNTNSVVACPHRYNPNDETHEVFNLDRLIGGMYDEDTNKGWEFYSQFFQDKRLLHKTTMENAVLSKVVENAYRFMEIVIAQELKKSCDKMGLDFLQLRSGVNTKWNIDLKEARDGVGGKCLGKDIGLTSKYFEDNDLIKYMMMLNERYINEKRKENS